MAPLVRSLGHGKREDLGKYTVRKPPIVPAGVLQLATEGTAVGSWLHGAVLEVELEIFLGEVKDEFRVEVGT